MQEFLLPLLQGPKGVALSKLLYSLSSTFFFFGVGFPVVYVGYVRTRFGKTTKRRSCHPRLLQRIRGAIDSLFLGLCNVLYRKKKCGERILLHAFSLHHTSHNITT